MATSASSSSKHPGSSTFVIAISILGGIALIQMIALAMIFLRLPKQTDQRNSTPSSPGMQTEQPMPSTPVQPNIPGAPSGVPHANHSVEAEKLLKEGMSLLNRGNLQEGLERLLQADELLPNTPEILVRLAHACELTGNREDAILYWQRLLELDNASEAQRRQAKLQLSLLGATSSPQALPSTSKNITDLRESVGLQPGAALGIIDCRISDGPTEGTQIFRISIKSRPGDHIDIRDVKINMVIFEKEDGNIVPTESTLMTDWLSKPVDWEEDNIEILQVNYPLPQAKEGEPAREYYGYKIEVYYKNQLHDFRTEPASLRDLFPPKVSIDPEDE